MSKPNDHIWVAAPARDVNGADTLDASKANFHSITLKGNSVCALENIKPGQFMLVNVTQDMVGGHSLGFTSTNTVGFSVPFAPAPGAGSVSSYLFTSTDSLKVQNLINTGASATTTGGGNVISYQPGGVSSGDVFATWAEVQAAIAAFVAQGFPYTLYIDSSITNPAQIPAGLTNMGSGLCTIQGNPSTFSTCQVLDGAQLDFGAGFTMADMQFFCDAVTTIPILLDDSTSAFCIFKGTTGFTNNVGSLVPCIQFGAGADLGMQFSDTSFMQLAGVGARVVAMTAGADLNLFLFQGDNFTNGSVDGTVEAVGGDVFCTVKVIRDGSWSRPLFPLVPTQVHERTNLSQNITPSSGATGAQPTDQIVGQQYYNTTTKNVEIATTTDNTGGTPAVYGSGEGSETIGPSTGPTFFAAEINNFFETTIVTGQDPKISGVTAGKRITIAFTQDLAFPGPLVWNTFGSQVVRDIAPLVTLVANPAAGAKTVYDFIGVQAGLTVELQLVSKQGA